ncbi:S4 domain protein [Asticcacaulis biprosthecium C19]|uniref:Pseudouridine synthase n=1 Tax=Asticcacaulis biprosthecium C19 TaxID=715226 RepID=F4QS25_9CAUL|nr:pseudouridine synthase [Asticcacaulis biprosthecium]EGF89545.1 S4 domain protein [Asticcacaulis biprosthecium C19]
MTDESNAGERDVSQPNEAPQTPEKTFTKKPFVKKDGFKKEGGKDGKPPPKATERIAKVLARAGLASRREVERLIGLGKIAVNGRILETPAVLVSSADIITVEGQVIGKAEPTRVWRYHKPVGLITTHSDPQGRPTLFDQLPTHLPRVISVGRLDLNSEGLLLLTNDGELARSLEKPSSGWVRRYRVRALGHASQSRLDALKDGTTVEGVIYGPMEATIDKVAEKADGRANVWLTVAITEGKNREVRKVLESIGLKVNRLIRLAYGPFQLGNLETGEVEEVGPRVIRELLADVVSLKNLPPEGASQTGDAPRERPARGDARGEGFGGRRGGGDRFDKGDRPDRGDRTSSRPQNARGKPEFAEKREFKERDFDQRPRFEGDGEARDRKPERPFENRPFGERKSFGDRKPYGARDGGDARSSYTPRPDRGAGNDRKPFEKKPYAPRPAGDDARSGYTPRPERGGDNDRRPYAKTSYAPRPDQGESGAYERAKREFGAQDRPKPRFDRPAGDDARSSYKPRPERSADGAQKPYASKPYAKKPYAPRPAQGEAGAYDRAKREFGGQDRPKPRFDRPAGDDSRSSYSPRPDRGGDASKPYAAKPYAKKPYDNKPRGDRPAGEGYKKPYAAKPYGARADSRDGGDSNTKREYAPRPDREVGAGGGYKKPFVRKGPPRDGEGGGERSSYAKPFQSSGRPAGDRPAYKGRDGGGDARKSFGDRPRSGGFGGKPGGAPRSDGPRGPRSDGPRSDGPRPGGKPPFRKPRDQ